MGGTLHNDETEFTLKESRYWHMARRYTKMLRGMLRNLLILNPKE